LNNHSIRTLFITRETSYPPTNGYLLRNWQNISIMTKFGAVGVFSTFDSKENPVDSLPGVDLWHPCQISKPSSFGESLKKLNFGESLQRLNWRIRPSGSLLAYRLYSQSAAQELQEVIKNFKPDLIIFEGIWMYGYLPIVKKYRLPIIFDDHNVEAITEVRTQNLSTNQNLISQIKTKLRFFQIKLIASEFIRQAEEIRFSNEEAKLKFSQVKFIEGEFIRQAKQVWVCSEEDSHLLQEIYGKVSDVRVVPNSMNLANYDSVRLGECTPPNGLEDKHRTLIFTGDFSYPPNREAAELLINQIYPQLSKIYPDCRLLLVGQKPTQFMEKAAKENRSIIVTGRVPEVLPYLAAASVFVVPLLKGGGTRLKILEAFSAGCPVVSTAKGAEGLKAKDGEHLLIRDKMDEVVAGVLQIWSEPSLAEKLANSAYELVKNEYSWETVSCRIKSAISEMFSGVNQ